MNDLDKAREWAGRVYAQEPDTQATCRVIQSLPDQIIDAEKVREVAAEIRGEYPPNTAGHQLCSGLAKQLEALITPPLPTLAELIEQGNDPKQYQWMQAEFYGEQGWITHVGEYASATIKHDGVTGYQPNLEITPLPGGTKMALPSLSVSDKSEPVSVETEDVTEESRTALPRPEDVPEGEAWLVKAPGGSGEFVALKTGHAGYPWAFADDSETSHWANGAITLIARLVPETVVKTLLTVEDYENAAEGTIVREGLAEDDFANEKSGGMWYRPNRVELSSARMARTPRTVLWEPKP